MKYQAGERYPNLAKRPAAPARGRGRLQVQLRRAVIAAGSGPISSSVFYDFCYVRKRLRGERISQRHGHSVWRILRTIADPIGRTKPYGAILWRIDPSKLVWPKPRRR